MAVKIRVYLSDDEFIETEVDGATPIGEVLSWAREEGRMPSFDVSLRRSSAPKAAKETATTEPKRAWRQPVIRLVA